MENEKARNSNSQKVQIYDKKGTNQMQKRKVNMRESALLNND